MNQERWSKLEAAKKKLEKFQQQKIREQHSTAVRQQEQQDSATMLMSGSAGMAGRRSASLSPRKHFQPSSAVANNAQGQTALPFGGSSMLPFMPSQSPTMTDMSSAHSSPLRQSQNLAVGMQQQPQGPPIIIPPASYSQKENEPVYPRREELNISPSFQKRVDLAPVSISKSSSTDSIAQEWREKYENTCDQLQVALQDLSKAKHELEKQVEAKANLFGECSKLRGDVAKLEQEKESLVLENKDLTGKVDELSFELQQSPRPKENGVDEKVAKFTNQLQEAMQELNRTQQRFHESRQENEVLKIKLKNMERQSIDRAEQGSMTDLAVETGSDEVTEGETTTTKTDNQESLENTINNLRNQLAAKTAEFNQLRSENVEMSEQLDQLRLKTVEVIDINAEMTTKLDNEMFVRMKLTRELESLLILKEEMDTLKTMMRNDPSLSPTKYPRKPNTAQDTEPQQIVEATESTLITNLQSDNAKLKTQVDKLSHLTEQLQMELETVPEYIERYHQERKYLKEKTREKDGLIHRMVGQYNEVLRMLDMYARTTKRQGGDSSSSRSSLADIAGAIQATEHIHREAMEFLTSNESLISAGESSSPMATESAVPIMIPVTQFPACPSCQAQSIQIDI